MVYLMKIGYLGDPILNGLSPQSIPVPINMALQLEPGTFMWKDHYVVGKAALTWAGAYGAKYLVHHMSAASLLKLRTQSGNLEWSS